VSEAPRALEGVRIIDFSHVFQGPVATQLLGDFGADVIKVERPGSGDWSRSGGPLSEWGAPAHRYGLCRAEAPGERLSGGAFCPAGQ
jgi:crotonobetainyl-CoA:carnitine CoA-transferase CaiB-like acyl-CoA transferase